jgi:hypothetical protein
VTSSVSEWNSGGSLGNEVIIGVKRSIEIVDVRVRLRNEQEAERRRVRTTVPR